MDRALFVLRKLLRRCISEEGVRRRVAAMLWHLRPAWLVAGWLAGWLVAGWLPALASWLAAGWRPNGAGAAAAPGWMDDG